MSRNLQTEYLGWYKPSFFSLVILGDDVFTDDFEINPQFSSVFLHEYIHFMQDLLTFYGVNNINILMSEYFQVRREVVHSTKEYITLPFQSNDKNLNTLKFVQSKYWGTDWLSCGSSDFEILGVDLLPYEGDAELRNLLIVSVEIVYKSSFERDSFDLGAIHFLENMAHVVERRIYFEENVSPFPYKVVEKILKYFFEQGESTDYNLVLFMENALATFAPAAYLLNFVGYCKLFNLNFTEKTIRSFHETNLLHVEGLIYKPLKLYYNHAAKAKNLLKTLFNHEALGKVRDWSQAVFSNAIKLKRDGFSFTELLFDYGDDTEITIKIRSILKKIGTPIMTDRKSKIVFTVPIKVASNEILYILGLEAIIEIINGSRICPLIRYCKSEYQDNDITNSHCYNSPWERAKETPQCIVGALWIIWGFSNKKII